MPVYQKLGDIPQKRYAVFKSSTGKLMQYCFLKFLSSKYPNGYFELRNDLFFLF